MISPAQDPYASRTDRGSAIISRQDPVVHGDGHYADALDAAQLERYERDGFLLLEDLLSPGEVRALAAEVERMSRDPSIMRREEAITEPGSNAVRSIFMVHVLNPCWPPDARSAPGQRGAPDPRVRGVRAPVARQHEAGLQGQGVLLAFGLRDLARRGRHARHAGAELLGAADRQQRQQRPVDAGAGFAPAVHFLRRPDAQRAPNSRSRSRSTACRIRSACSCWWSRAASRP